MNEYVLCLCKFILSYYRRKCFYFEQKLQKAHLLLLITFWSLASFVNFFLSQIKCCFSFRNKTSIQSLHQKTDNINSNFRANKRFSGQIVFRVDCKNTNAHPRK